THRDSSRTVDSEQLRRMTDVLVHRGPDAAGYWAKGNIGLGHRRLSIIDLSTGDQPMHDDCGNVIAFNGEIYNYVELREELKAKGHVFKSSSDTEVILAAYREWGVECQNRLNGMWAFAIWDSQAKRLFLSRDRIGEKPLYYAGWGGSLLFGSEIKAVLEAGVPAEPDYSMMEVYLCLSYVPAPHTFYKHVRSLPPGHYVVYERDMILEQKYWDLPAIEDGEMLCDKEYVHEQFESLLRDSVRIRMRSDVPFGAFLSGGLDSSSVVALMSEVSSHPVETFTIGFEEKAFDERPLAQMVADCFGTKHHERTVEPDAFDKALERVNHHYDDPFGDSSAIPTGYVSEYAVQSVKMVLTGDGGDEVLSGYTMYQGEKFAGAYQSLPRIAQRGIASVGKAASATMRGGLRYKLNRAVKVAEASAMDFESRLIAKVAWGNEKMVKAMLAGAPFETVPIEDFIGDLMRKCPYRDPFYRLMYYHLKNSLPNDMLVKVDRMSMAHSLETRVPFLDHRLIEFMVGVHKDVKMNGYERKSVLRDTVGSRLPEGLLKAPKKGFGVPLREWFKGRDFERRLGMLRDLDIGLNKRVLGEVVDDTVSGRRDYGNFLWMLFVARRWFEGRPAAC
ncbi:MAG: asparagine synthase (glutamine-hydrolyzing), partial [Verrucomicrobiota bacterium]